MSSTPNSPRSEGDDAIGGPAREEEEEGARDDHRPADTESNQDREKETAEESRDPRVEALETRVAELEDLWLRALADVDNIRKRQAREIARVLLEERMGVAREFLQVVDDLERALDHAGHETVMQGLQGILDEAVEILGRLGFPRRDDGSAVFDPFRHHAVATRPDTEHLPGTVIEVVRPGYGEGETQLRPASVVVSTEPS